MKATLLTSPVYEREQRRRRRQGKRVAHEDHLEKDRLLSCPLIAKKKFI